MGDGSIEWDLDLCCFSSKIYIIYIIIYIYIYVCNMYYIYIYISIQNIYTYTYISYQVGKRVSRNLFSGGVGG